MTDSRLQDLAVRISRFASGDRSQRIGITAEACAIDDEICKISQAFEDVAEHMDLALERQALIEGLIANASVAVISTTLEGIVTSWNPAAVRTFGYSAGEMIGQTVTILIPDELQAESVEVLDRIAKGDRPAIYQTIRRRKDGKLIPISVAMSPIPDRHGVVVGASKFARDITDEIKAEEALKRAEERYELVLAGMSVGVWDYDVRTEKIFGSARLHAMLGTTPEKGFETLETLKDRVHPQDRPQMAARMRAHLYRRETYDMEYRLRLKDGQYGWVHATCQAVWDADGNPVRLAGSIEDISDRTKLQSELVELVEKLKKSNKDLDEFAYAASHDLKAPLRVIDNTSQWLMEDLEPHLTPETRENMALLRSRVKRMEKLLGDLLEYSRIGRSQDERFAEVVNGYELLENILELLSPAPGFSVIADPAFLEASMMRMPLQQVLMNLIGNAIKHHDKTEGTVRVGLEDEGAMVAFTVEDDGPGVPAQFHDKVFEMFRTLKPRDQVEGSGMGLAMVRKNVEMFGGTITLQSSQGCGAKFRFTWPKSQPRMAAA